MRRMGSRIALMAAVAVLAVGCSGTPADEPGPVPTGGVPTTPATPTPDPTETEDPFAFDDPSEIDVAYVQRVLDAIYAVVEETIRIEVRAAQAGATEMPREIIDMFATVYGQDKLISTVESAEEAWSSGEFETSFSDDPQPAIVVATDVVDATERCIIATFTADHTPRLADQSDPVVFELIALFEPKPGDRDPDGLNESPWRIVRQFTLESVQGEPGCSRDEA
jgi:hypothetical protein